MQAGLLNEVITILRRSGASGADGAMPSEWIEVSTKRAQVVRQNGRKALANGEIWYPNTMLVKVRYDRSISESNRLRYDGDVYEITSVAHDGHDNSTTISCEKINEG